MLLEQLVHPLEGYQLLGGSLNTEIRHLTDSSAQAVPQCMFVCISGYHADGHDYLTQAADKGAVCIVAEKETDALRELLKSQPEIAVVLVRDTKKALALLASEFYGNPARRLCLIGVTGTKGKTTTACMLYRILQDAGIQAGLIGTLGASCGAFEETIETTTPDALTLHRLLARMEQSGCTHVILEVSSQSLMCRRVYGISFAVAVFTNLSPDHIGPGEHRDVEEYSYWKSRLFACAAVSVLHLGADGWEQMSAAAGGTRLGFYLEEEEKAFTNGLSRFPYLAGRSTDEHGCMKLSGLYDGGISVSLPGRYNRENALAALTAAYALGLPLEACGGLADLQVPGRTELLRGKNYQVIIDYAHNESSMQNLLAALRKMEPERLICIYGSGGNRSRLRRVGMGRAGGKLSDLSVLTEDNSRHEPLDQIIAGLIEGVESVGGEYVVIPDRREAIRTTIASARPGDLIAIIGKGHEAYQEIGSVRYPFSDREEARVAMRMKQNL